MRSKGVPDAPMVVIPGNPEYASKEQLRQHAERSLEECVERLTGKTTSG